MQKPELLRENDVWRFALENPLTKCKFRDERNIDEVDRQGMTGTKQIGDVYMSLEDDVNKIFIIYVPFLYLVSRT